MTPLELAWLEYSGHEIPPRGGWIKVRCAAHDESRPSAQVNVELGKWICYAGCGRGDIFDLVKIRENISEFPEQKRIAAEKFGWVPEDEEPEASAMNPNPHKKKGPKKKWVPPWV